MIKAIGRIWRDFWAAFEAHYDAGIRERAKTCPQLALALQAEDARAALKERVQRYGLSADELKPEYAGLADKTTEVKDVAGELNPAATWTPPPAPADAIDKAMETHFRESRAPMQKDQRYN